MALDGGELHAGFLAGEPRAVREIESWIRRAAGPYRVRFGADWEDVVQDCLLELTIDLRRQEYRGRGSFRGYVWGLVNHSCIDYLRARRPREWVDAETLQLSAGDPSPLQRVAERQTVEALLRFFNRLPERCRDLLRGIVQGKSYQEMSDELGVAPGTLRVRVLRCRQKAMAERDRQGEKVEV